MAQAILFQCTLINSSLISFLRAQRSPSVSLLPCHVISTSFCFRRDGVHVLHLSGSRGKINATCGCNSDLSLNHQNYGPGRWHQCFCTKSPPKTSSYLNADQKLSLICSWVYPALHAQGSRCAQELELSVGKFHSCWEQSWKCLKDCTKSAVGTNFSSISFNLALNAGRIALSHLGLRLFKPRETFQILFFFLLIRSYPLEMNQRLKE